MTAPHIVGLAGLLAKPWLRPRPDLMRELLQTMINALLSADADAVRRRGCRSEDRINHRNGYRHRPLDTRVGTIDVAVPKLRSGTYFPEWLLERRKRAESALITVVADLLPGRLDRWMDKLVKTLGIDSLSKSQVSHGRRPRRTSRSVPSPPTGRGRPFTFVTADAFDDQGPREQAGRQSRRAAGYRSQRHGTAVPDAGRHQ